MEQSRKRSPQSEFWNIRERGGKDGKKVVTHSNYHCTPIWTSADDEKLRTAVYDPESLTKLLQKLEEGTMADLSKKADGDSEGPWLNAGASYSKHSREEGDDEELQD